MQAGHVCTAELLRLQILDALPQDAASIATVATQLVSLALERAAAHHAEEVSTLQGGLAERDAAAAELESRLSSIEQERDALARDLQVRAVQHGQFKRSLSADGPSLLAHTLHTVFAPQRSLRHQRAPGSCVALVYQHGCSSTRRYVHAQRLLHPCNAASQARLRHLC